MAAHHVRLFDVPQAKHFCSVAISPIRGASQSLSSLYAPMSRATVIREGTTPFQVHQISQLHAVERWLLYSVCHYRRSLDMFVPAAAPWAQVTMYYASFFAANAILGMFGAWVGHTRTGNKIVDVADGTIGAQQLQLAAKRRSPNGANGSHREFWDFFYDAAASIKPWAGAQSSDLDPANGDYAWQIDRRNSVNYDMSAAWQSSLAFASFKPNKFRKTLSADLATQLEATEGLIGVALKFARELGVQSSAYDGCGVTGDRVQVQRRLVSQAPPHIVSHSSFSSFIAV